MGETVDLLRGWRSRYLPVVADVCGAGISLLVAGASVLSSPRWVALPRWVLAVAGLVGTSAIFVRRTRPVAVTLVGVVVQLVSGNPVALGVGLYTTAVQRRDRVLVALSVLAAASFAFPDLTADRVNVGSAVIAAILLAVPVVSFGAYVGVRRDLVTGLRDRAERAEAERELRAEQARAAERARIAREMHDVLAHKVSLIALHAGALEVNAGAGADRVEESAALIRSTAHETLEELRDVLGVLRAETPADGADLVPTARAADIARLVESSRAAGVAVGYVERVPDLPDALARAIFRIVQEALTNVHKHARGAATEVTVVGGEDEGVWVTVSNARPVAAALLGDVLPGSGAGLLGLAERTRLLGGELDSGPDDAGGWRVRAWLPWPQVQAAAL